MADRTKHRSHMVPLAAAAAVLLGTTSFAGGQTTSSAPVAPAKANGSHEQSHNAWRSTKLDGAAVYNEQGTSGGTIDDMLLDSAVHVSNVVLSVGGFLGMDSKCVEVPFSTLRVESSKGNTNDDDRIVLSGVTKDSLRAMATFSY